MKKFNTIVSSKVVAEVHVSEICFKTSFDGLPQRVERAFKGKKPEYDVCETSWEWRRDDNNNLVFVMQFLTVGNVVFEEE